MLFLSCYTFSQIHFKIRYVIITSPRSMMSPACFSSTSFQFSPVYYENSAGLTHRGKPNLSENQSGRHSFTHTYAIFFSIHLYRNNIFKLYIPKNVLIFLKLCMFPPHTTFLQVSLTAPSPFSSFLSLFRSVI